MKKALLMFVLLLMTGWSSIAVARPVQVIASFSILGDLVRQVGGDHIVVTTLVGPDSDAHVFQPTPKDARYVAQADMVVINGLGFEGWIERLISNSGYQGHVLTASEGIPHVLSLMEDGVQIPDPHAWQDLNNGLVYVRNITEGLIRVDPDHAADYRQNARKLSEELAMLDRDLRQRITAIPASKRMVITSHDAFGYFAHAYGVKFLAPVGMNTEDEPGAGELAILIRQIRDSHIRALFLENMTNPALIRQLADETGIRMGPTLYADALSSADGPAASYQAMFQYNVDVLVAGMKDNQPPD